MKTLDTKTNSNNDKVEQEIVQESSPQEALKLTRC